MEFLSMGTTVGNKKVYVEKVVSLRTKLYELKKFELIDRYYIEIEPEMNKFISILSELKSRYGNGKILMECNITAIQSVDVCKDSNDMLYYIFDQRR